jgi:hypothetical protein
MLLATSSCANILTREYYGVRKMKHVNFCVSKIRSVSSFHHDAKYIEIDFI